MNEDGSDVLNVARLPHYALWSYGGYIFMEPYPKWQPVKESLYFNESSRSLTFRKISKSLPLIDPDT